MPEEELDDEGSQTAILSVSDIEAEARRVQRLLDTGTDLIAESRATIAKLDAALDAGAKKLAAMDGDDESAR